MKNNNPASTKNIETWGAAKCALTALAGNAPINQRGTVKTAAIIHPQTLGVLEL